MKRRPAHGTMKVKHIDTPGSDEEEEEEEGGEGEEDKEEERTEEETKKQPIINYQLRV